MLASGVLAPAACTTVGAMLVADGGTIVVAGVAYPIGDATVAASGGTIVDTVVSIDAAVAHYVTCAADGGVTTCSATGGTIVLSGSACATGGVIAF